MERKPLSRSTNQHQILRIVYREKKGIEREQGIKLLEEFADLLISISIDESEKKIKKYQTHTTH